jgi:hypothetical protein
VVAEEQKFDMSILDRELEVGSYMLCCGKGVMSHLHASHLMEVGDLDVKVYSR